MHNFYFNNHWLSHFGGRILNLPQYEMAQRDFETIIIPGRNQELLQENNRYENVKFKRKIAFLPFLNELTARQLAYSIINWFNISEGYCIYRDTYNPGYFSEAFISNIDTLVQELPTLLTTTINFSRAAYWHSDEGQKEKILSLNSPLTLNNPENYVAKPIIKVIRDNTKSENLAAKIKINGETVYLYCPPGYEYSILDGENMQYFAYKSNGAKTFVSDVLPPDLQIGKNIVELIANNCNGVSIIPNWRRL